MSKSRMKPLQGTEVAQVEGARAVGPSDPHQLIEVSVIIKHRRPLPADLDPDRFISHVEFAREFGAEVAHIDKLRQFARDNKLSFLEQGDEVLRRTVKLSGTVIALERAFSVELIEYEHENGTYRGHPHPILIPEEYVSFITGVFGLDNRQIAQPYFRFPSSDEVFEDRTNHAAYTPPQVARLYRFPEGANGTGQRLALIELGGGYRPADVASYFHDLHLQAPTVRCLSVDQANNCPGVSESADCQVMLDIEMAGAIAPGLDIDVYFAPNTPRGVQDALSQAVHDQLTKPSAICIGWGAAECDWSGQSIVNFHQVAYEAAMMGITITVASGNGGSGCGKIDGKMHISFPASCPYVMATGGTRLNTVSGTVVNEVAWNSAAAFGKSLWGIRPQGGVTGGGYSNFFARHPYQDAQASHAGRGVPDVVANADPDTGYKILVDGKQMIVGGTSAAAALMAGLVIVLNHKLNRKLGFVNPALYGLRYSNAFHQISAGTNGAHSTSFGWNPVAGLGSPVGTQMLHLLELPISEDAPPGKAGYVKVATTQ